MNVRKTNEEWTDWEERHGRQSCESNSERSGSERVSMKKFFKVKDEGRLPAS
jgi:hypothetical protein